MANVKLRARLKKDPDKGKIITYYVDIWFGNKAAVKRRQIRIKDVWCYDRPSNTVQRNHNKLNKKEAKNQAERIQHEINTEQWITKEKNKNTLFFELLDKVISHRGANNIRTFQMYEALGKHIKNFLKDTSHPSGFNITVKEIDASFSLSFKNWLKTARTLRSNSKALLSDRTQNTYFIRFCVVMNDARDIYDLIDKSPTTSIEPPKYKHRKKRWLTVDELDSLKKTPCVIPQLKEAFLFACGTGLRSSDITSLKWRHIVQRGLKTYLEKPIYKSDDKLLKVELNGQLKYLGGRSGDDINIFCLKYDGHTNAHLRQWCADAGLKDTSEISSHTARHTFAVQLLSNEVPIYTVSQLLCHSSVSTTEKSYAFAIPDDMDKYMTEKVTFV